MKRSYARHVNDRDKMLLICTNKSTRYFSSQVQEGGTIKCMVSVFYSKNK